jgi:hypothetical protein
MFIGGFVPVSPSVPRGSRRSLRPLRLGSAALCGFPLLFQSKIQNLKSEHSSRVLRIRPMRVPNSMSITRKHASLASLASRFLKKARQLVHPSAPETRASGLLAHYIYGAVNDRSILYVSSGRCVTMRHLRHEKPGGRLRNLPIWYNLSL